MFIVFNSNWIEILSIDWIKRVHKKSTKSSFVLYWFSEMSYFLNSGCKIVCFDGLIWKMFLFAFWIVGKLRKRWESTKSVRWSILRKRLPKEPSKQCDSWNGSNYYVHLQIVEFWTKPINWIILSDIRMNNQHFSIVLTENTCHTHSFIHSLSFSPTFTHTSITRAERHHGGFYSFLRNVL